MLAAPVWRTACAVRPGARHPAAVDVIAGIEREGAFTFAAWRRLNDVLDELREADLEAVLAAIARARRARQAGLGGRAA